MERRFRVEVELGGDLVELYEGIMTAFERASGPGLGEMNRTLLQTGLLMHLTMMTSFGLIPQEEAERLRGIAESVAGEHLMWEIAQLARDHWSGSGGSIDLKA